MAKKQDDKVEVGGDNTIDDLEKVDECFIITPIGDFNSDIFIKANGLIDSVIQPVLDEFSFKATAAHQINKSGSINNQIIKRILEDKLVIVNLTGLNPNVMYELAIRHAARLPVIIMAEKELTPRLPFDITDQRTIFYSDTFAGNVLAKSQLRDMITVALADEKPDNPIYAAASQDKIFQTLDNNDPLRLIMDKIEALENKISINSASKQQYPHTQTISLPKRKRIIGKADLSLIDKYSNSSDKIIDLVRKKLENFAFAYPSIELSFGPIRAAENGDFDFSAYYVNDKSLEHLLDFLSKSKDINYKI